MLLHRSDSRLVSSTVGSVITDVITLEESMPQPNSQKLVIVESYEEFDERLHEFAVEVAFSDESPEAAYEAMDSALAGQLQWTLIEQLGKSNDEVLYHQNFDWWPTKTRFLYLDSSCVTWPLVEHLQSLLIGEVHDWRINIHVLTPLYGDETNELGAMNIYHDWLLVQRSVYDLLYSPSSPQ